MSMELAHDEQGKQSTWLPCAVPSISNTACSNSRSDVGSHSWKISKASQSLSPFSMDLVGREAPTTRQRETKSAAWLLLRFDRKNTEKELGEGPRSRPMEWNFDRRRTVTNWSGVRPVHW